MKTSDDFIKALENGTSLKSEGLTLREYANELQKFQANVCKIIAGNDYYEGMRFDEATFRMDSYARRNNLRSNADVHSGILTMKTLSKEMSITMAGVNAERLVSRTLEYMARPNSKIFTNVYLKDGNEETELDDIILTDAGVVILEVKNIKADVTISEEGRLIKSGSECFDKTPLGENMARKRRMLKEALEKATADEGLDIPVVVDSFIVFSTPKGVRIHVKNEYRKERYCFRTNLNKTLESYCSNCHYDDDQLAQLAEVIAAMATNVRASETELNYDEVINNLATALEVLQIEEASPKTTPEANPQIVQLKNTCPEEQITYGNSLITASIKMVFSMASSILKTSLKGA